MIARPFRKSDVPAIDRIWQEHYSTRFSLPDRSNLITEVVYEDESGVVIGYGHVKLLAEATIIFDKKKSKRTIVEVLRDALLHAFMKTEKAGLKQLQVFSQEPDFSLILEKHFGFFRPNDPGELLVRGDLNGKQ